VGAVAIRLHAELRSRWRAWLTIGVIAGVAAGLVLAVAGAARRADSTVDRWRAATETMDVWVGRGDLWGLEIDLCVSSDFRRSRSRFGRSIWPFGGARTPGAP
jgi:O-antigen ligase